MRGNGWPPGRSGLRLLSGENLAEDFGSTADVTQQGIGALYACLSAGERPEVAAALERWERLVSGACGHDLQRPSKGTRTLAERYGVCSGDLRPAEMLFAVHTYYALVLKVLLWEILAWLCKSAPPSEQLQRARSGGQLKSELERLEAGTEFEGLDNVGRFGVDPFTWVTDAWTPAVEAWIRRLADRFGEYDLGSLLTHAKPEARKDLETCSRGPQKSRAETAKDATGGHDLLKPLYGDLFPRPVRHMLGEYYTPDWLARHVLDEVGYGGDPEVRLLDPACGSGTFLVTALGRIRDRLASSQEGPIDPATLCRQILTNVVGFDLNPLAVLSARVNYLIAICDLVGHVGHVEIPVYLHDSILAQGHDAPTADGRFDCVVGNPPWIAWDDLPDAYRQATKPLWQRYGLFSLSGTDARHGGGKKDLSMLMLYAAADRYLKDRGRLSMVLTQTVFQTKGAGDGFRRFRLGDEGPWLRVEKVNDMASFQPFPEAANWTATVLLQKGRKTTYPVPYVKWSLSKSPPDGQDDGQPCFEQRLYQAEPIDPDRPTSPWFLRPEGLKTDCLRLVGPSDYQAHLGANTGGANGVYWVTVLQAAEGGVLIRNIAAKGKRDVATVEHVVETDLVYPLIRWADVARYRAVPSAHLLLVQDVDTRRGIDEAAMRRRYPKTYAYLTQFAPVLRDRAAYQRYQQRAAFYSMYNVGRYTVAPVKVVWRRMDRRINAAVVETHDHPALGPRPAIPQETCVLIAAGSPEEAHYLCALLNSSIAGFLVASHSVRGGKGFGTPSILDFLRLRRFDPGKAQHVELADFSRRAHQAARQGEDLTDVQREIDQSAGRLWGLSPSEVDAIGREVDGSG